MINICEFIKTNIEIRQYEIENTKDYNINKNCLNLLNLDDFTILNIINSNNPDNYDLIYRLSSKSFENPNKIISNRLEGLTYMLSNMNYMTRIEFDNIKHVEKYKYFLISFYILAGQIFTDGNHRVCYKYLLNQGINKNRIHGIIKTIDLCRRYKNVDWNNIHEFIQKLINNLITVINIKNENILLEKIENLFI